MRLRNELRAPAESSTRSILWLGDALYRLTSRPTPKKAISHTTIAEHLA